VATRLGPYELDTIVIGDCLDVMRQMPDGCVDLVIADPPYGIGYHSNYYKGKNPHTPIARDWNFQAAAFIRECARLLADGGAFYLFSRWDVYPLLVGAVETAGLKLKTKIVWMKNNWSAGDLTGSFGNQYEEMLFIVKGRHQIRGHRWSNIWQFDRIPATRMLHPTQKPVALLRRAIESSSDEGSVVLDPFAGTGSTGVAAQETGRHFLLADIDPRVTSVARRRLGMSCPALPEEEPMQIAPSSWQLPDPGDWGIHPEELRFIYDELRDNVKSMSNVDDRQPGLSITDGLPASDSSYFPGFGDELEGDSQGGRRAIPIPYAVEA